MADLNNLKIPVFSGINDTPVAPTASKAGNGSHLIAQFNNLVDETETALNEVTDTIPSTKYVVLTDENSGTGEYTANANDKIVVFLESNPEEFAIHFPSNANLQQGDSITVIKRTSARVYFDNFGDNFSVNTVNNTLVDQAYIDVSDELITFIWISDRGWQAFYDNNALTVIPLNMGG